VSRFGEPEEQPPRWMALVTLAAAALSVALAVWAFNALT
jgi:hypothetical protein